MRHLPLRRTALVGTATLTSYVLSGCFLADPGPSGLDVLNDTGSTIWLDDEPANDDSTRLKVQPGDYGRVSAEACSEVRVEAQSEHGEVVATLDERWCPAQLWVIHGSDDWTLGDSP